MPLYIKFKKDHYSSKLRFRDDRFYPVAFATIPIIHSCRNKPRIDLFPVNIYMPLHQFDFGLSMIFHLSIFMYHYVILQVHEVFNRREGNSWLLVPPLVSLHTTLVVVWWGWRHEGAQKALASFSIPIRSWDTQIGDGRP